MRLICPNCDAEYEVEAAAIPLAGRDVQCSNCGHAWFQAHPEVEAEAQDEAALFGPPLVEAEPMPAPPSEEVWPAEDLAEADLVDPPATGSEAGPETGPEELDAPEAVLAAQALEALPAVNAAPATLATGLPRRSIDESVLAVLREEAEREAAARRGERPRIETQTELPLPEPAAPQAVIQDVVPASEDEGRAPVRPSRKGALLPEIEEIKSSLHPGVATEEAEGPAQVTASAADFRSGLVYVVLVGVMMLAIYVLAPVIAAKVPSLQAPLQAYVALVNRLRLGLDHEARALIAWLRGLAGGSAG